MTRMSAQITQDWRECSPGRMLATLELWGVPHHLVAVRVRVDPESSIQVADSDDPDTVAEFETIHDAYEGDGHYMTVQLPGFDGDWLLLAHPYCN